MFRQGAIALSVFLSLLVGSTAAHSNDAHVEDVKKYVTENIAPWLNEKVVIEAIKAQNEKHASLSEDKIKELDKKWRAEIDASDKPLIESVLKNKLSEYLSQKKNDAQGMLTEVFVMDNKGLNVGQSDITSDYWQGDEAKWKKSFGAGPDAVFVDEVEQDESTQQLQVQVSLAIKDPETGEAIGAITIGIDVGLLLS